MRDWKPKKRKNKKMKKLFLIIVALFALQMQAQTYTEWSTTNALPTEAGTYRLTTDVTLSAAWVVPEGETVLDLNDHIVKLVKESGTDHVISIGKDRTLTIEDNAATKTTRYWEEHKTYHYWRNPSTTDNGLGLTTDSGCVSFHLCGSSCNSSSYDAFVRFLSSSLCLCISLKSVAKQ